jgi:hypothetical protein
MSDYRRASALAYAASLAVFTGFLSNRGSERSR